MKYALRIIGWAVFAFLTYLIVEFVFDGSSYWNYYFEGFLSPHLLLPVYLLLLIVNVVFALMRKDYVVINAGNAALSGLMLLIYHVSFANYPPFGHTEAFIDIDYLLILSFYLSALALLLFGVWMVAKALHKKHALA
jgi:hypothetical protein